MTRRTTTRTANASAGFTLIELLIVVALIGILASITAPFLIAAKAAANEASAIGSMRALTSSQYNFSATCGSGFYATSYAQLVSGNFASPDMGVSPKSGFVFVMAPGLLGGPGSPDCNGDPTQADYYSSGTPLSPNTGRRGFATNQIGTIWQDLSGASPVEPFVEAGTVSPIRGQ